MCNLAQERWRDVAASVEWHGCAAAIGMPVLPMGAALPDKLEAVALQQTLDLPWLQDRDGTHDLRDLDSVRADELSLETGFPVLEQERHNLAEVVEQLVNRRALGVRARPAGDVADQQPGVRVTFDDSSKGAHSSRGPSDDH